jgi:hypothetical protein
MASWTRIFLRAIFVNRIDDEIGGRQR